MTAFANTTGNLGESMRSHASHTGSNHGNTVDKDINVRHSTGFSMPLDPT